MSKKRRAPTEETKQILHRKRKIKDEDEPEETIVYTTDKTHSSFLNLEADHNNMDIIMQEGPSTESIKLRQKIRLGYWNQPHVEELVDIIEKQRNTLNELRGVKSKICIKEPKGKVANAAQKTHKLRVYRI